MRCRFRHLIGRRHLSLWKEVYMESNPDPTYIAIRIEPEGLRERRNAMKLKACPFCGGTVRPRWAPWLDGAPCWEIEHTDIEQAVAAKFYRVPQYLLHGRRRCRTVSVLRRQAGDYLSLRTGNHLVCRGCAYAISFICHLQMPRLYRRDRRSPTQIDYRGRGRIQRLYRRPQDLEHTLYR